MDHRPKVLAIGGNGEAPGRLRALMSDAEIEPIQPGPDRRGLRALYDERPDVVVLDLDMTDPDGLAASARFAS